MPTISVVIPLYNSEPFLAGDGMLASVQAQTFRDLEIILVDDGSTDETLATCRRLAEFDSRVSVLAQANGGESAARNAGIHAARGRYVSIVDHDDRLHPETYAVMAAYAMEFAPDIVRCNFSTVREAGVTDHAVLHEYGVKLEREYIRREILPSMIGIVDDASKQLPGHWTYLHRRELLTEHRLAYDETKRKETDHRFIVEALAAASSIVLVEQSFYRFVKRAGSNTSSYSPRFDNLMDNFALYERLLGSEYNFESRAKIAYNVSFVEECIFYVLAHKRAVGDKRQEIERILSDERVRDWYSRLEPMSALSKVVKWCTARGHYSAAQMVFEAKYLKTRVRRSLF